MNSYSTVSHPVEVAGRAAEKLVFLARSLDRGGAERQLVALAVGLAGRGHDVAVMVFFAGGALETELRRAGVSVVDLGKRGRWDVLPFLIRLVRTARRLRPGMLHGYLGVANLLALFLKPVLPDCRIVWGVRASNVALAHYDWLSRTVYALECRVARFADLVIANSRAGRDYAVLKGFPAELTVVIENGIDTVRFAPDASGRAARRAAWGDADACWVGMVGRLDPMKDHATFLEAASRVARSHASVRFVCVGGGTQAMSEALQQRAVALGLGERVLWLGAQDAMPSIYNALDVMVLASAFGEGFSNSVAEAMACGVPCVVTDVGDSARIVGETGPVVAPGDAAALAQAIVGMVALSPEARADLGARARARVVERFGVARLLDETERVLGRVRCG